MALLMADPIERPLTLFGVVEDVEAGHAGDGDGVGGGPTLDDLIVGAWEGLTAHAVAACPLCEGTLRALPHGRGSAPAGRCDRCGTTIS